MMIGDTLQTDTLNLMQFTYTDDAPACLDGLDLAHLLRGPGDAGDHLAVTLLLPLLQGLSLVKTVNTNFWLAE